MKPERKKDLDAYYREAATWAEDRDARDQRSRRIAWWVAGGASFVAIAEAFALVALAPLKTVEPYTLLVDRQTGYVEALKPLERQSIAPDAALTRSFLVQYVIARESFDLGSIKVNYRKTALWSAPEARAAYIVATQATNPTSPLASLPRTAQIEVQVKSVSSLGPATSLVRFRTHRADLAASAAADQDWAAVISYRYSGDPMTVQDRLINPLGFQVTRYRRDAENIPDTEPASLRVPAPTVVPNVPAALPTPGVATSAPPPVIPMAKAGASAKKL
ncbi:virB8 family protein [Novosphingobium sp. AAP1]|uniref:virB8 family protein n=1 Tax=Novosphingobium sp. AAP1 TaxID=1523413 RepID=UPI0009E90AF6|nr:VirB8/TrbF family protein [Novosphingobium sp. AAP1]